MDGSADRPYEPRFDLSKMNLHFYFSRLPSRHFDFSFSLAQQSSVDFLCYSPTLLVIKWITLHCGAYICPPEMDFYVHFFQNLIEVPALIKHFFPSFLVSL